MAAPQPSVGTLDSETTAENCSPGSTEGGLAPRAVRASQAGRELGGCLLSHAYLLLPGTVPGPGQTHSALLSPGPAATRLVQL